MNCEKVTPPLPIFVNLYYYYSFFMLFLSLLITPLQFYIILTKSTNLKSFKWLILNHTIWCLAFEIFFTTTKPFLIAPAIGGFPMGLLRNGNITDTVVATYIGCLLFLTQACALITTVINRYLYAFPSKLTEYFNMKLALMAFVLVYIVIIIILTIFLTPYFSINLSDAYKSALAFDPCLKIYFSEPAFSFFPFSKTTFLFLFIAFLGCCVSLCGILFVMGFFIFLIFSHKTSTIAKLQKSLIISAFAQILISGIYLFCPLFCLLGCLCFQVTNVSNFVMLGCCVVVSHSFLESLTTLYFVTPYRKAIQQILAYTFPYFDNSVRPIQISQISHLSDARRQ